MQANVWAAACGCARYGRETLLIRSDGKAFRKLWGRSYVWCESTLKHANMHAMQTISGLPISFSIVLNAVQQPDLWYPPILRVQNSHAQHEIMSLKRIHCDLSSIKYELQPTFLRGDLFRMETFQFFTNETHFTPSWNASWYRVSSTGISHEIVLWNSYTLSSKMICSNFESLFPSNRRNCRWNMFWIAFLVCRKMLKRIETFINLFALFRRFAK